VNGGFLLKQGDGIAQQRTMKRKDYAQIRAYELPVYYHFFRPADDVVQASFQSARIRALQKSLP